MLITTKSTEKDGNTPAPRDALVSCLPFGLSLPQKKTKKSIANGLACRGPRDAMAQAPHNPSPNGLISAFLLAIPPLTPGKLCKSHKLRHPAQAMATHLLFTPPPPPPPSHNFPNNKINNKKPIQRQNKNNWIKCNR